MKQEDKKTIKLQDTNTIIGSGSRLERYWQGNGFEKFYTKFRSGLKLPIQYHSVTSVEKVIQMFKLNAIGFGNWVTQEDRFNYVAALTVALYDIDKVVKFKGNLGLNGLVSFSFGARGTGSSIAHFESSTFIINVTRYSKDSAEDKSDRFVNTGGAGAVAHEWGHAIDYYFAIFVESNSPYGSLSGGRSVQTQWQGQKTPLRILMDNLLKKIIWKEDDVYSNYYKRLQENFTGDYMFRRNEIFARTFEKYVSMKLAKIGITNKFLNDTKYSPKAYMTNSEMENIMPEMDSLIAAMSKKLH